MILGKPGAGKTTFLKRIAVDCVNGIFQPDLIPVFVELRKIKSPKWNLLDFLDQSIGLENWQHTQEYRNEVTKLRQQISITEAKLRLLDKTPQSKEIQSLKGQLRKLREAKFFQEDQLDALLKKVKDILRKGKLLILMDGLDEIPTEKMRTEIQRQFRQLAEDFPENRFMLTCRTQVVKLIPTRFTVVEIADFKSEQVLEFVNNWLASSGFSGEEIIERKQILNRAFKSNLAIKELSKTPVLLSLICVVLSDEGDIPADIVPLYKKGIQLLLKTWNEKKDIKGWEIGGETYRKLSISEKESLLAELAALKFENSRNSIIFEQESLATQIYNLLKLANKSDGLSVLKAIESHHGLLVERADELWSFSHLTFQEYFAVQWLARLNPEKFVEKMSNRNWQRVTKQLVRSKQYNQYIFQVFKANTDRSIETDSKIQFFLKQIARKSTSSQEEIQGSGKDYKLPAIRAFYFSISLFLDKGLDFMLDRELTFDVAKGNNSHLLLDKILMNVIKIALDKDFSNVLEKVLSDAVDCSKYIDKELSERLELLRLQLKYSPRQALDERKLWLQSEAGISWSEELRQIVHNTAI